VSSSHLSPAVSLATHFECDFRGISIKVGEGNGFSALVKCERIGQLTEPEVGTRFATQ